MTVTTIRPGFIDANEAFGQVEPYERGEDALGLPDGGQKAGTRARPALPNDPELCPTRSKSATCPFRAPTRATASPPSSMSAPTGSSMGERPTVQAWTPGRSTTCWAAARGTCGALTSMGAADGGCTNCDLLTSLASSAALRPCTDGRWCGCLATCVHSRPMDNDLSVMLQIRKADPLATPAQLGVGPAEEFGHSRRPRSLSRVNSPPTLTCLSRD